MARSMVENNRSKLKSKRGKFRFTKMLPKSAMNSKSMKQFISTKSAFKKKLKKEELSHWLRVLGFSLVVIFILYLFYISET